jgi:RNA polymerase sigma factor (sigma-70 family)
VRLPSCGGRDDGAVNWVDGEEGQVVRKLCRLSDSELLRITHEQKNHLAFEAFFLRHRGPLIAFLIHHTRNLHVAEDLASESFAVAYDKVWSFDPERGEARAWLFGIARRAMLSSYTKRRVEEATRRKLGLSVREHSEEVWSAVEASLDDSISGLVDGLNGLPRAERVAIIARIIEQREYADIARLYDASEAAIRQRISRGLRKLAAVVKREPQ